MDTGWLMGIVVGGIKGKGVAVDEIDGADVAAGVEEVTVSFPPQAARNTSRATTAKDPILIRHRPNTWKLLLLWP